ncbi:ABC transporter substrate-binding protein [Rhodococcus sp. IEGM 1401]|uniref:ABC transporter substrate-binding protein n=1 Tax=unclassified Rhodococcus (in: high G+C Gram-positive bacteria) TaxID=192944 RepID=UPI0022B4AA6A|nr:MULTISPECIES: ABC transporter substrate-binding protein [unclassified Rhodococcus (in: high G+C Gram-positive bacteria)]MCZ4562463.1 ABC transporter substrate-binding protein [Rhodococcus sp. IEGM 1401]MDI9922505.1 ABC transporter substrate-binding protein [Rhodococcus sp. IEGM 1372]MDV8035055.1 ABC transporter substrate-binding protein [Rhodococcus sp. IEGM 1414]MDV8054583.1 ABC transporter substrate-binding protein [Rhodococcus sp. IEGM 1343]MDV8078973.1 ABC transporter substrate-binding 
MKKSVQLVVTGASVLALAVGCSSTDEPEPTGNSGSADGFPVTVDHRFGETVIDTEPTRVVTIGFNEQDFALALGVKPVATRGNLSYDYRQRPWAQEALGGTEIPEVGSTDLNLEQIAAQAPDLILGPYSFIDQGQYDQLSGMAPTIADIGGYENVPAATWQQEFAVVGEALGKQQEAQDQTSTLEQKFADTEAENPQFTGKSLSLAFVMDDGSYLLLGRDDIRALFFTDLGFEIPDASETISPENLDRLDTDVLVIAGQSREQLQANPIIAALDVVEQDRTVYIGSFSTDLPSALGYSSPLSLDYAIDGFTPMLAAATDDDPSTVVPDA